MLKAIGFIGLLLAGCSTVADRRADPPIFQRTSTVSLQAFQGCFANRMANQDIQYLPRGNGGTYTAGFTASGMPRYVTWLVDVDDLGSERRVTIYAVDSIRGPDKGIIADVEACL
jgi:hypothetical protein